MGGNGPPALAIRPDQPMLLPQQKKDTAQTTCGHGLPARAVCALSRGAVTACVHVWSARIEPLGVGAAGPSVSLPLVWGEGCRV